MYQHIFSLRRCDSLSPIESSVALAILKVDTYWDVLHQQMLERDWRISSERPSSWIRHWPSACPHSADITTQELDTAHLTFHSTELPE